MKTWDELKDAEKNELVAECKRWRKEVELSSTGHPNPIWVDEHYNHILPWQLPHWATDGCRSFTELWPEIEERARRVLISNIGFTEKVCIVETQERAYFFNLPTQRFDASVISHVFVAITSGKCGCHAMKGPI
ncbi:hypothetical protein LCGC14_2685680 [marine sediment metagenome]|uniref:Uncharacterized protein n=1 Tax=marine sediment metagenome TaxID=412755 RepID=A0A0F8ZK17_9ZZZZ